MWIGVGAKVGDGSGFEEFRCSEERRMNRSDRYGWKRKSGDTGRSRY